MLRIMFLLFCAASLCACSSSHPPVSRSKHPNILLILVDDPGYHDLSPFSGHDMPTPNLQAFAASGVTFTRHYADSTCQPARTALLTGLNPRSLDMTGNGRGIPPHVDTLADRLDRVGYTTYHIGKWHLGWTVHEARPKAQGFDHWFGFLSQFLLDGPGPNGKMVNKWPPTYINPWLQDNGGPEKRYKGQLTDILATHTRKTIKKLAKSKKPWFINLWTYAAHTPYQPDKQFSKWYSHTREGQYKALIRQLDARIGQMIQTLKNTGQYKNTMIVIESDNGGPNHERDNNYPFAGAKNTYTEGGLRTPLMIHWPRGQGRGQRTNAVVSIRDVAVSVVAAAGGSTKGMQGHDLFALATDRSHGWSRPLFWESDLGHWGDKFSVLSANGRWRLRTGRLKLELYDLKNDPSGAYDVASEHPRVVKHLLALHRAWHNRMRQINVQYKKLKHGAVVRGDDMLRTLGRGGIAFGIAMHGKIASKNPEVIAEQPHVWKLTRQGRKLTLNLGTGKLHGKLPKSAANGQCTAIVWTGFFHRAVSFTNDHSHARAALYVNGNKVDGRNLTLPLPTDYMHKPTWIGRNAQGKLQFTGQLGKPRMIKDYLFAKIRNPRATGVKLFSRKLCSIKQ